MGEEEAGSNSTLALRDYSGKPGNPFAGLGKTGNLAFCKGWDKLWDKSDEA
jgi:hypothetical protein